MTLVLNKLKNTSPFDYHTISGEELDISSTQIRSLIVNNRNLSEHLPENVIQFIKEESIY